MNALAKSRGSTAVTATGCGAGVTTVPGIAPLPVLRIFGGGSCLLPLQVTTSVWHLHTNVSLGSQYNLLIRGVPATSYDEGRSIELYTGRVAIDIFSETPARALRAALRLAPINAPGSAAGRLPAPVYCPELVGPARPTVLQKDLAWIGKLLLACECAGFQETHCVRFPHNKP